MEERLGVSRTERLIGIIAHLFAQMSKRVSASTSAVFDSVTPWTVASVHGFI